MEDILLPPDEVSDLIVHRSDIVLKDNAVEHYSCSPLRIGIVNKGVQG